MLNVLTIRTIILLIILGYVYIFFIAGLNATDMVLMFVLFEIIVNILLYFKLWYHIIFLLILLELIILKNYFLLSITVGEVTSTTFVFFFICYCLCGGSQCRAIFTNCPSALSRYWFYWVSGPVNYLYFCGRIMYQF